MTESRSAGTRCVLICGAGLLFCCGLLHVPTAVLAHRGVHEALTAPIRRSNEIPKMRGSTCVAETSIEFTATGPRR
jgi:hypothetical protein